MPLFALLLMIGVGLFWVLTYVLAIRQGFKDRTYGIPLTALCANLSWEAIFAFLYPPALLLRLVILAWFALDLVILYQALRFGPDEFPEVGRRTFYVAFGLTLVTAFCLVLFISWEFQDLQGSYAAFGQNLLMSVLFLLLPYRRGSLRGQSLGIAICKLLGTAMASLAFFLYVERFQGSALMYFLYASIFVYDLLYVMEVWTWARARQFAGEGLEVQVPPGAQALEVARVRASSTVSAGR